MLLNVKEISGESMLSMLDTNKIQEKLHTNIKEDKLILDFTNIILMSSSFIETIFSNLYSTYNMNDINNKIQFINLDDNLVNILKIGITKAKSNFKK